MILTARQTALFVLFSVLVVFATFAIPTHPGAMVGVDLRTGRVARTAEGRLQAARATGDAAAALQVLAALDPERAAGLVGWLGMLRHELSSPRPRGAAVAPRDDLRAVDGGGLDQLPGRLARTLGDEGLGRAPVEEFFAAVPVSLREVTNGVDFVAGRLDSAADGRAGVSAARILEVARAFRAAGRERAELRWLLRGIERHPADDELARELVAFYLARARTSEAFAVSLRRASEHPVPAARGFWERHAQLARWTGALREEVAALERIVDGEQGAAASLRLRLLKLYVHFGESERGVRHAVALAEEACEVVELESAADSMLRLGRVDAAVVLLRRLVARAPDPTAWQLRLAEVQLHDLRVADAIRTLEAAVAVRLDPGVLERLESLYRRTRRGPALADLLEWRLAERLDDDDPGSAPGDGSGEPPDVVALEARLVDLLCAVGEEDRARRITKRAGAPDRRHFLNRIGRGAEELEALRARALELDSDRAGAGGAAATCELVAGLRPYFVRPEVRDLAESLLARHTGDPGVRDLRVELLDVGRSDAESTAAARRLAEDYPGDAELLELWAERASWAGSARSEWTARLRLAELHPEDDENRWRLVELLQEDGEYARALPHLETLATRQGLPSRAASQLVDTLSALRRFDEAAAWLGRIAAAPGATPVDRVRAADELFFRRNYDAAAQLYRGVLAEVPDHPGALLRMGQIRAWTNDPAGAVPYLTGRLAVSRDEVGLVAYELGEAYWALGETALALRTHRRALVALDASGGDGIAHRTRRARVLARLERWDEAGALFAELLRDQPENVDLLLDHADALLAAGAHDEVGSVLARAGALAPGSPRVLRTRGRWLSESGDHRGAAAAFAEALEQRGPDAGLFAERASALDWAGEWDEALETTRAWLALQPDSIAGATLRGDLEDRTADFALGTARWRSVGDDEVFEAHAAASTLFADASCRVLASLGYGSWRGRAAGFAGGSRDAAAEALLADLAFELRPSGHHRLAAGVSARPGAPGDPVGGFLAAYFEGAAPFSSLRLRAYANELWDDPAAAVGLRGRQHGLDVEGYAEVGPGLWVSGRGIARALEVEAPDAGGREVDGQLAGELSLGYRFTDGLASVGDTWAFRDAVPAAPRSPFPGQRVAPDAERWFATVWVGVQAYHLLDDQRLADLLPVSRDDDFAFVAGRVDRRLGGGFGASVEANLGLDLGRDGTGGGGFWGAVGALQWRPSRRVEWSARIGRGAALGREGAGTFLRAELQGVVRW